MTEFEQRKKNLTEALNKPIKIINDIEKTEKKLMKQMQILLDEIKIKNE